MAWADQSPQDALRQGVRAGIWWHRGAHQPPSCLTEWGREEQQPRRTEVLYSLRLFSFCPVHRELWRSLEVPHPNQGKHSSPISQLGCSPCSLKEHSLANCTFAGLCRCPRGQKVH